MKPPTRRMLPRSYSLPVTRQDSVTKPVVQHTTTDPKPNPWKQRGSVAAMRSEKRGSLASIVQETRQRRQGVQAVGRGRPFLMRRDSMRTLDLSALHSAQSKNN